MCRKARKEYTFTHGELGPNHVIVDNEDNETRMLFYLIGHCLSNMRGAIELKQKGYYDMDDVNGMIDFFHDQVEALHSL